MQYHVVRKRSKIRRTHQAAIEALEPRQMLALTVASLPASDVEIRSATIGLDLQETGIFKPNVFIYWGDDDAGDSTVAWDHSIDLKTIGAGQHTVTLADLEVNTTYYYRSFALDVLGGEVSWTEAASFTTLPPAEAQLQVAPPAHIGGTSAQISGQILDDGGDPPIVSAYFGTLDAGETKDAWQHSQQMGFFDGPFTYQLDQLTPNTSYYYRLAAENGAGTSWSEPHKVTTVEIPTLRISEFMAANLSTALSRTRVSADHEFPKTEKAYDWIEIQNATPEAKEIGGYYLTDDSQRPTQWSIPAGTVLPAHGTIVVYASGENITNPALDEQGRLHTNFQLSSKGEYLAFVGPDGRIVQEFTEVPQQYHNVSYGVFGNEEGRFTAPTPGESNGPLGPHLENVQHSFVTPNDPLSELIVTAEVQSGLSEIQAVTLHHRSMYEAPVSVAMVDDGSGSDQTAQDGVFTGVIPGGIVEPGQMLRYYVTASAVDGLESRAPTFVDEKASPEYYGLLLENPTVDSNFPVFNWFVETPRRAQSVRGTRASVAYQGEFHDNVFVRLRGGTARSWPKRSYKIEFNDDHHFLIREGVPRVDEFNLNATYTDKTYLRARLTSEFQLDAGTPSPETFHLRVQQNGEFHSIAYFVEQPDRDFLRRHHLDPEGSLYKAGPGSTYVSTAGFEKKTRPDEGRDDLAEFVKGLRATGDDLDRFLFDNVNIPAQINFMATHVIVQNIDGSDKNHYVYRDTNGTGEWFMMPWDLDLVFGPDALNTDRIVANENTRGATYPNAVHPFLGTRDFPLHGGKINVLLDKMIENPRTREMLLRRIRTMADEFLATGYFHQRIDQLVDLLQPEVALDREQWGRNAHFGSNRPFDEESERVKVEYLDRRLPYLTEYHVQGGVGIPTTQPPNPQLVFGENLEFSPASGNQGEEFFSISNPNDYAVDVSGWSIEGATSTTLKPGTVLPAGESLTLAADVATFRKRTTGPRGDLGLFVQSFGTELPNTGGELKLVDRSGRLVAETQFGTISIPANADNLRISEINFNPLSGLTQFGESQAGGSNFEFVEFTNIGQQPIELAGVQLISITKDDDQEGIEFSFDSQTLEPGQYLVVVKNREAFVSRFGDTARIANGSNGQQGLAGEFANRLGNGGETITVTNASNELIQQFRYEDEADWPARADGLGSSLEVIDFTTDYNDPNTWQASRAFGGSPGRAGEQFASGIVINELLANNTLPAIDQVELYNSSDQTITIANWYLSDSGTNPLKYQFSADTAPINSNSYLIINETTLGFGFKGDNSDDIYLIEADSEGHPVRFADSVVFGPTPSDTSIGRWPNGTGAFVNQQETSWGQTNRGGPTLAGDFDLDGTVSITDVDSLRDAILTANPHVDFDLNGDSAIDRQDLTFMIESILGTHFGDANLDGLFNSSDLVLAFQAGEYEDDVETNSDWSEGDWNCDGDFSSSDLVLAFQSGSYTNTVLPVTQKPVALAAAILASHRNSLDKREKGKKEFESEQPKQINSRPVTLLNPHTVDSIFRS